MTLNEQSLAEWRPNPLAPSALFSPEEAEIIERARRRVAEGRRTIAYCVYENPFAKAGGIFAVATHLPPALREAGDDVLLISPFHRNLATTPPYHDLNYIGDVHVPFAGDSVRAELFEYRDKAGNLWVLVQSWSIFDAGGGPSRTNPYAHAHSSLLLRDSLFISAAVPVVLASIGREDRVVVHAQDWQLAATALTVKQALLSGSLRSAAVVLTSHNPYDQWLSDGDLAMISHRQGSYRWPLGHDTVYQRMIPLTDAPLSTVSPGFAAELTSDPLQTNHFARHLQAVYRAHGVAGINNPLFGKPASPFSEKAEREAAGGLPDGMLGEKLARRAAALEIIESYRDERVFGALDAGAGRPATKIPDETPIFMMFGRLDPGQKGFDLLARAIEGFERNEAKFILTPIVGDGAGPWVEDLRALAERRAGDMVVYPFRMEKGYMEAMSGATFAVMPSFYEPFGAATEAYLVGTPVIARATGGLTDQVADYRRDPARATGILFREKLPLGSLWPDIVNAATPEERVRVPLYALMAEALFDALKQGAALWRDRRPTYGRMLRNLYPKAASFSPKAAAEGYRRLYDVAAAARPE